MRVATIFVFMIAALHAAIDRQSLRISVGAEEMPIHEKLSKQSEGIRMIGRATVLDVEITLAGKGRNEAAAIRCFFVGRMGTGGMGYYSISHHEASLARGEPARFQFTSKSPRDNPVALPSGWVIWISQGGLIVKKEASDAETLEWMDKNPPPVPSSVLEPKNYIINGSFETPKPNGLPFYNSFQVHGWGGRPDKKGGTVGPDAVPNRDSNDQRRYGEQAFRFNGSKGETIYIEQRVRAERGITYELSFIALGEQKSNRLQVTISDDYGKVTHEAWPKDESAGFTRESTKFVAPSDFIVLRFSDTAEQRHGGIWIDDVRLILAPTPEVAKSR